MHRSRVAVVLIDHPEESYADAAGFWAAATGSQRSAPGGPSEDGPYESLNRLAGGVLLELQRTGSGTPPRVHLDIETDDVGAEVARLTGLGATIAEQPEGFTVLHDPGGMVFCVVPVQTDRASFDEHATIWG